LAILYKKIYNEIYNQIAQGYYHIGDKIPSEKEISDLYSVSRITSKRVLDELEKEGIVNRVRGKGSFLVKNIEGASVFQSNQKERGSIAIIFPTSHDFGSFSATLEGCTKVITERGYKPNLYFRFSNLAEVEELLESLLEDNIQGVIYYPYSLLDSYEILNNYVFNQIPIVTMDKYYSGIDIKSVCSDNFKSGKIATDYLIKLGHKKIGFLSDVSLEGISSIRDRYYGYCQALKENNLPYDKKLISIDRVNTEFMRHYDEQHYISELKKLYDSGITALIAINDIVASYVFRVAKILDIRIPEDLSVIGFDGIPFSEFQEIPLTTVLQDFNKMGEDAANLVIDEINGIHRTSIKDLPVYLVERSSCSIPYTQRTSK
jgi:GntR family transcriptional regulator of arabinose operon